MKKVFVLVSDETYLEHTKSLFYAAKTIGKWSHDFCLIANNINDERLSDFKKFGIEIIHRRIDNQYYGKYFLFDVEMKKWDYVLYMDCDFTIFDDLNKIVSDEILSKPLLVVDEEPFFIHSYFCQNWNENEKQKSLKELKLKYNLDKLGFNSGFMSFNTKLIKDDTLNNLIVLSQDLQSINNHTTPNGTEQPILNLYFENNIHYIADNKVCFWKQIGKKTIAVHHCRWEAPWKNFSFCILLNKTYIDNYKQNLKNFYETITDR